MVKKKSTLWNLFIVGVTLFVVSAALEYAFNITLIKYAVFPYMIIGIINIIIKIKKSETISEIYYNTFNILILGALGLLVYIINNEPSFFTLMMAVCFSFPIFTIAIIQLMFGLKLYNEFRKIKIYNNAIKKIKKIKKTRKRKKVKQKNGK